MDPRIPELAQLLLEMEAELRCLELWEEQMPAAQALASTLPFCHDTLEIQQWLQWVMLPRMAVLVEHGGPLPGVSDIHPLADYRLGHRGAEVQTLLDLIRHVDRLLSGG